MPQEPSARQQTELILAEWILKPHDMQLQLTAQKILLPSMREVAGVTDLAIQIRANGERKFLLWVGKDLHQFDTPIQAADWLMVEQQKREKKSA